MGIQYQLKKIIWNYQLTTVLIFNICGRLKVGGLIERLNKT